MHQEERSDCKIDDSSSPVLGLLTNNNNINNAALDVDEIVQIWKDVCECTDSKFYKEKIDYFLKTIDALKRDIRVVKLQNKKLVRENCEIKNELKVLSERLVDLRQSDGNDQQKGDARTPLQGSSADHSWLFTTQQWLENVLDNMNPSTDADNFEKNDMKGKSFEGMNISDEDVIKRFQAASYFDEYDEVFEVEEEEAAEGSATYSGRRTSRTRRISDVIDSIGDVSPSYSTKEKSNSFCYEISAIKHKEFQLQSPPRGRPIPTMTDSPSSPPMTPGSDLGYGSTGMPTPPSNAHSRAKSFRFSASSVDISSSPSQWDTQLDAKPIGEEAQSSLSNCLGWAKPEATMPSLKDSRSYNMKHLRRGRAIIFNHEEFRDMPPRKGSSVDVAKLTSALTALGFAVQTYNDLEVEKLKNIITELSVEDHSDADCIVITVLTHGLSTGCLMAKDYAYPTEHLWTPFTADKCPSLAGKPKLFFIQSKEQLIECKELTLTKEGCFSDILIFLTGLCILFLPDEVVYTTKALVEGYIKGILACRGEKLDGGIRLISRHQTDTGTLSYKIPTMADFLLAFSTFEGFYSWRHPETGTWFIQCLCQVLEEEGEKSSLQDILLEVSRRVAIEYESYNDLYTWQHEQKQVPQINSTLLRQVYFSRKD